MLDSRYAGPCVRGHTSISIIGEVAAPFNVGASLQVAGSDGVASDRTDNSGIRQLGLSRYDAVGNVVVDGLRDRMKLAIARELFPVHLLTLCSSCLTSKTVPSLKVQRATSASLLKASPPTPPAQTPPRANAAFSIFCHSRWRLAPSCKAATQIDAHGCLASFLSPPSVRRRSRTLC